MRETIQVGHTWMSECGNLFRVLGVRDAGKTVDVKRIGFVQDSQEYRVPESEFTFHARSFGKSWRVVARNPRKYDEYLATCPDRLPDEA